jgi:two-component system KDP operon response regulator KdpE
MTATATVLVVEDEVPIQRFLRSTLAARGYRVVEATTLAQARLSLTAQPPDLLLLDLGLPDGDGLELVRELREWSQLPVVVLSARGQETIKVAALDAGADDYLTKPFGVPELLARLRAALRRGARSTVDDQPLVELVDADGHDLRIDLAARRCQRRSPSGLTDVALTPTEFKLLAELAKHVGKVLTHAHLLRAVWGPHHESDVAYLRVYLGQLRQKLERQPGRPRWLLTEPGVGYRLDAGAEP